MPTTPISGLASGLDWQSLVTKLMAAEAVPQNILKNEKTLAQQKTNVLDNLKTNLTALQTSVTALSSSTGNVFSSRTASVADTTSGWTASASTGTEIGSHSIQVTQLATKAQLAGAAGQANALSSTSNVSGLTIGTLAIATPITAGQFTVNGVRVNVAATDSLQDVFDRVSTATGGAVSASYDPVLDKVRLSSAGEIILGSANDTSNFLTSLGLNNNGTGDVSSPKSLGALSLTKSLVNANLHNSITAVDGSGNGSVTINGVSISYNANNDSIANVLARINSSAAGVSASYDSLSDRFKLTNKTTGDTGISVSESAGGLLGALGLSGSATLTRGKNAQFSVDGSPTLTSASNTFDASIHGITGLSVTAASVSTQTISVGGDTSGMRSNIEDFVAKFNAVQSLIAQVTQITPATGGKVTAAILASNHDVGDIATSLRREIFGTVAGLTGSIQRLEGIGIDFNSGANTLTVKDSAKLDAALANNAEDVSKLFTSSADGLATRLNTYLTKVTGSTGLIATQTATLTNQSKSLDDQIAAMQRHLDQQQTLLTNSFIHMESAQQSIQSQLTALNNAFGLNSTSKSNS